MTPNELRELAELINTGKAYKNGGWKAITAFRKKRDKALVNLIDLWGAVSELRSAPNIVAMKAAEAKYQAALKALEEA